MSKLHNFLGRHESSKMYPQFFLREAWASESTNTVHDAKIFSQIDCVAIQQTI